MGRLIKRLPTPYIIHYMWLEINGLNIYYIRSLFFFLNPTINCDGASSVVTGMGTMYVTDRISEFDLKQDVG